jgi:uncharacterized coiled-coil protein SlyX
MKHSVTTCFLLLSVLNVTAQANIISPEDCSPENGYNLGKSGEPMPTSCPPELRVAFEKSYKEGQQEFYQISSWEDTLNALDLEIAEQEQERHELDEELNYLQNRINELRNLASTTNDPAEQHLLTWAESELATQQQQRRVIDEQIHHLKEEKLHQKPW